MSINELTATIATAAITRAINFTLPARMIYTAPSGQTFFFDAESAEYDETSYNERGELGVWWVSGKQYFVTSDQQDWSSMSRTIPATTLSAA